MSVHKAAFLMCHSKCQKCKLGIKMSSVFYQHSLVTGQKLERKAIDYFSSAEKGWQKPETRWRYQGRKFNSWKLDLTGQNFWLQEKERQEPRISTLFLFRIWM